MYSDNNRNFIFTRTKTDGQKLEDKNLGSKKGSNHEKLLRWFKRLIDNGSFSKTYICMHTQTQIKRIQENFESLKISHYSSACLFQKAFGERKI